MTNNPLPSQRSKDYCMGWWDAMDACRQRGVPIAPNTEQSKGEKSVPYLKGDFSEPLVPGFVQGEGKPKDTCEHELSEEDKEWMDAPMGPPKPKDNGEVTLNQYEVNFLYNHLHLLHSPEHQTEMMLEALKNKLRRSQ